MNQIQVKWNKISPADLSSTFCAQFFAFSRNSELLLIEEVKGDCLFTKIIQSSANFCRSIYEMDIWVGSIENGGNNLNENIETHDIMDVLAWSAKVQMQDEKLHQLKFKEEEEQKISKRTRLRMLASIA